MYQNSNSVHNSINLTVITENFFRFLVNMKNFTVNILKMALFTEQKEMWLQLK